MRLQAQQASVITLSTLVFSSLAGSLCVADGSRTNAQVEDENGSRPLKHVMLLVYGTVKLRQTVEGQSACVDFTLSCLGKESSLKNCFEGPRAANGHSFTIGFQTPGATELAAVFTATQHLSGTHTSPPKVQWKRLIEFSTPAREVHIDLTAEALLERDNSLPRNTLHPPAKAPIDGDALEEVRGNSASGGLEAEVEATATSKASHGEVGSRWPGRELLMHPKYEPLRTVLLVSLTLLALLAIKKPKPCAIASQPAPALSNSSTAQEPCTPAASGGERLSFSSRGGAVGSTALQRSLSAVKKSSGSDSGQAKSGQSAATSRKQRHEAVLQGSAVTLKSTTMWNRDGSGRLIRTLFDSPHDISSARP